MDYELSPEQRLLRDALRGLLDEVMPLERVRALAEEPELRHDSWRRLASDGWLDVADSGAAGEGVLALVQAAEEIGGHFFPGPFSLTAALVGPLLGAVEAGEAPAVLAGEAVAAIVLPRLAPRGRPPWRWQELTVRQTPRGARLTGTARAVPFAASAQLLLVPVEEDGGGVSLGVLRLPQAGVEVKPCVTLDVTRPAADIVIEDVPVSDDELLCDDCLPLLERGLAAYLLALNGEATGAAERVLRATVEYVSSREQFGVPVGSFQAIKHMLADSSVDLELARTRSYHVAWETGQSEQVDIAAVASARLLAARAYRRICERAIQCHGGVAFTAEQGLHLWYRNALAAEAHLAHPVDLRHAVFASLDARTSTQEPAAAPA